jgi:gas vesicle protein
MTIMSKKGCGLLTGLAVGAGIGLLFAPKKGSETRKELTKKINELWEQAKDIEYDDVKKSIEKKIKELQKELSDLDKEKVAKIARDKR